MLLMAAVGAAAHGGKGKPVAAVPTYAHDLRPILQARCVVCHSQANLNNAALSGGLALDSYTALKKGVIGKAGAQAIYTVGKSGSSELMKRLRATSPTLMMPKGGPPLSAAQIALFQKWIDGGAPAGVTSPAAETGRPSSSALPLPADPGRLDVSLMTRLQPTPDLLKKDTPKDAALAFALKVGPLPPITALAFSPDGMRLAVGGYRAVTLWDTTTGKPAACLTPLAGPVQALAFSAEGSLLAVASGLPGVSGEVRVYAMKTLTLVGKPLAGHSDVVLGVAWSPDGKRLVTASQDKTARLWEWPSGKALLVMPDNSDAVTRVCFAPDGKSLYTASLDHNVRQFNVADGKVLRVFNGHEDAVLALALSPDGKGLVSAGPEPRLRWWNLDNGDTARYSDGHGETVTDIVFSKDGKFLASASADKTVRLWDAGGGGQLRALEGSGDWLYAVALSPDGKLAAGAGAEGITRLWETANGRLRVSLLAWPPAGKATAPEWVALTPEGYYDASPAWAERLRPLLAGQPVNAPRLTTFFQTLQKPENVVKGWQGAALDPAQLPALPMPPKAPEKKPAVPGK